MTSVRRFRNAWKRHHLLQNSQKINIIFVKIVVLYRCLYADGGERMLNRELYLRSIADSLALLGQQVAIRNAINLYDINIVAETFYADLLNLIEDLELKNVNTIEKNAPGIDLIDEKNKISIQVTSDNTSEKIKHSIEEFISDRSYEKYDRMIILILTGKKNYTTKFDSKGLFQFDKSTDIWDIKDLIKKVNALDTERLKKINDFLQHDLNDKYSNVRTTEASEVETIMDLIEFISSHKRKTLPGRDVIVDPEYKINQRFKEFAESLIMQYTTMLGVYGTALKEVENIQGSDDAQDIITMLYLQDISIQYLDVANNDPTKALNALVEFFDRKLSENGKKYDSRAIKFFLINEMIKCSIFPNVRG